MVVPLMILSDLTATLIKKSSPLSLIKSYTLALTQQHILKKKHSRLHPCSPSAKHCTYIANLFDYVPHQ